jgi:hypothetical protein
MALHFALTPRQPFDGGVFQAQGRVIICRKWEAMDFAFDRYSQ